MRWLRRVSGRKPPPAVIGQQIADAAEVERRHRARHPDLRSPLEGVRYTGAGEGDLLHFVDRSPTDGVVEAVCRRFEAAGARGRAELRDALTSGDIGTVIIFGRRSAVHTLNRRDREPARLALLALEELVDRDRVDFRDVLWAIGIVRHALNRIDGVRNDDLRTKWVMTEVRLPDGRIGLTEVGKGPYDGTVDLFGAGCAVQAMLDADVYQPTGLVLGGTMYPVWMPKPSRAELETIMARSRAVVAVNARRRLGAPHDSVFLGFLVEFASSADGERWAALWADPAPREHAVLAVRVDRLAALFIVNSSRGGVPNPESDASLARWAGPVRSILTGAV